MSPIALEIRLFGPLLVLVEGEPMPRVRSRSVEWLLALLALRQGRNVSRSWLAGTLWPETVESKALENLRHALVVLRSALGKESRRIQSPSRDALCLALDGVDVDVRRFDRAIEAGDEQSLQEAVALYAGPLLEGCYEEWVAAETERRARQCLSALEKLAESALSRGHNIEAIDFLRRAESMDPLRDSIARRLMTVLESIGDPAAAVEVYRSFRDRLHAEHAAAPDVETTQQFQDLRARTRAAAHPPLPHRRPAAARQAPPPTPHSNAATRPPVALTSLIGREEEVATVRDRLSASRLVTLVGMGGVGKTRLAMEVAAIAADAYDGGAVWTDLASLQSSELVLSTIAAALGIVETEGAGVDDLHTRIHIRLSAAPTLLVVDNCEHLVAMVADVLARILMATPHVRVLATSRERLGIPGEVVWHVPSLALPDPSLSEDSAIDRALECASVRLFVERAEAARPGWQLWRPVEVRAVATICRRLDGIALAIELAAARMDALEPNQILERLEDRFALLNRGARTAPTRQRTLRALVDWSYDLLNDEERSLLRILSVFVGGWDLNAAETVATAVDPQPRESVLDDLTSLASKSLVTAVSEHGGIRYRMLETIRHYAASKLCESGEDAAARAAHLACFRRRAEELGAALRTTALESALDVVEREVGNFRAALAWALTEAGPPEAHMQLTAALWPYWEYRGLAEGRAHLETARLRSEGVETPERAQILLGGSRLDFHLVALEEALTQGLESLALFRRLRDRRGSAEALLAAGIAAREIQDPARSRSLLTEGLEEARLCGWTRGCAIAYMNLGLNAMETDTEQAHRLLEEGLSLAQAAGDPMLTAESLQRLGNLELEKGDPDQAGILLEWALTIYRRLRYRHATALTLRGLGALSRRRGNPEQALSYLQEAVSISREQGDPVNLAMSLSDCGGVFYEQGDYAAMRRAYEESRGIFGQVGNEECVHSSCMNLGCALFHLGAPKEARALHREALAGYQRRLSEEGIVWSLERLAVTEAAEGDYARAARLLGAASTRREGLRKNLNRPDREDWDRAIVAVRTALGETTYAALWAEGSGMTLEQAAAYASAPA